MCGPVPRDSSARTGVWLIRHTLSNSLWAAFVCSVWSSMRRPFNALLSNSSLGIRATCSSKLSRAAVAVAALIARHRRAILALRFGLHCQPSRREPNVTRKYWIYRMGPLAEVCLLKWFALTCHNRISDDWSKEPKFGRQKAELKDTRRSLKVPWFTRGSRCMLPYTLEWSL